MSKEVQYFCDICGQKIPFQDIRTIRVKFECDSDKYEELDICDKCYAEAIKNMRSTYSEDGHKNNKFGRILNLKLWGKKHD